MLHITDVSVELAATFTASNLNNFDTMRQKTLQWEVILLSTEEARWNSTDNCFRSIIPCPLQLIFPFRNLDAALFSPNSFPIQLNF
jgi:hypothetical protein